MADLIVEFEIEWKEVATTCDQCWICDDIIYGKQYQLYLIPGGETATILCESCYTEVIKHQ